MPQVRGHEWGPGTRPGMELCVLTSLFPSPGGEKATARTGDSRFLAALGMTSQNSKSNNGSWLGGEGGAGGGFVGVEGGVFGDAHHGEDFLEVGGEAEGLDLLAALAGGDHHLDDQGDAAGVQVLDFGEVEDDAFDGLGEAFVGAEDGGLGGAGDVAYKAEDGDGGTGAFELLNGDACDLILHRAYLRDGVLSILLGGTSGRRWGSGG
jgi:hypothetical protein